MTRRIESSLLVTRTIMTLATIATLATLAALGAPRADAQVGRRTTISTGPDYWVGLSYGLLDGTSIADGNSGNIWSFGYTTQIRATIEKSLQAGITAGFAAGFSTAPLSYISSPTSVTGVACSAGCQANADISQYVAFIRSGARPGFHGMFSLEAGETEFSHFRDRADGTALPPASAKYDFTFGFGGGFGYGVTTTSEVYVDEQFDYVLHPEGSNTTASAPRMAAFHVGGRIGF